VAFFSRRLRGAHRLDAEPREHLMERSGEVTFSEEAKKLYEKLWVSWEDIVFADYCAGVLLKKGWHAHSWERRGIYRQQVAFTTALITAYARPFTRSKGWPKLPPDLIAAYDEQEKALHAEMLRQRHTIYAHSDSSSYSVRPWLVSGFDSALVRGPSLRISAEEAAMLQTMASKLFVAMGARMRDMVRSAGGPDP
jgi:hypothetical protein